MEIFLCDMVMLLNIEMKEGFIILLVGLVTVFMALISLFVVFKYLVPFVLDWLKPKSSTESEKTEVKDYVSGEQIAAASAAVHLFLSEVHDDENTILTIHRLKKEYSPWSSKIYSTHQVGRR